MPNPPWWQPRSIGVPLSAFDYPSFSYGCQPKNSGKTLKMDGKNSGKPENPIKMDDLGGSIFGKHSYVHCKVTFAKSSSLRILQSTSKEPPPTFPSFTKGLAVPTLDPFVNRTSKLCTTVTLLPRAVKKLKRVSLSK